MIALLDVARQLLADVLRFAAVALRPGRIVAAENLFLRQHRRVLRLFFLPPYSPQLNPIERVWKLTRRLATHNRYFATLGELLSAVQERFALWRTPNQMLCLTRSQSAARHYGAAC